MKDNEALKRSKNDNTRKRRAREENEMSDNESIITQVYDYMTNQKQIRRERADILHGEDAKESGQRVIIPATFVGGPRYMKQRQQDALASVTHYVSPEFFITFTMNPQWEEIQLAINQTGSFKTQSYDRPDLVSRIFKLKVDSLMDDLTKKHIFGRVKANLYRENNKGETCGKVFPKTCRKDLLFGNNGYPLYKRRSICEGGHSFTRNIKGKKVTIDNSWVVPYNPYLCLKYNAHINVECSNSIKCIVYVTKYVNKGCDRILFTKSTDKGAVNEIKNFQEARYVNANEATWKIFKFAIHKSFPAVTTLDLHLEGENEVFYSEDSSAREIDRRTKKDTQLTAFFKLCLESEFAAKLYYHEIPNHFSYDEMFAMWIEPKTCTSSLGRIRAVTSKTVELFYLRLVLTHRRGPTSFKDLRTVDGQAYSSYREAVKAMGLLNDEETWKHTIMEIINHTNDRKQLRETYSSMLVFSDLEDQSGIWEETKDLFASDFLYHHKLTEYNDEIYLGFRRYTRTCVELWRWKNHPVWASTF
ncbi:uncharacterized protein LOC143028816 [Oratosquilla oratoria]|uniref:uncharacterized protein LOC143028816 n=1 Tax=Oratosquilla oratoria TaxID=337810 RepID=UPI003F7763C9